MSKSYRTILICLALAAATFVAYEPVRHNGFIGVDDNWYVYNNNYIKHGLTRDSIAWAFSFTNQVYQTGNWHPLTSLSHILDVEFFGLQPMGHHITNVILHAINTILLFLVLQYMTSKPNRSAIVAALFALHPLHVESVAWVSERKDVLSMLFWILTIYSYAWYARRPGFSRYILTLVFFAIGLMAKPMVVTLPFVLLLLDFWPLERFSKLKAPNFMLGINPQDKPGGLPVSAVRTLGWLIIEKVPFFALSAVVCVVTQLAQQGAGSVVTQAGLPLKARFLNVPVSYMTYIEKTFWPVNLAFFYPHRGLDIPLWSAVVSMVLLVVLTIFALYFWQSRKYLLMGWLWFLGTLVPVIGFVQVGTQALADRYTYIPLTGLFIIIVWGVCELLETMQSVVSLSNPFRKIILSLSAAAVILPLVFVSRQQVSFWRDDVSLFGRAAEVVPDNWWAYQFFGSALAKQGRFDEAVKYYRETLRIVPGSLEVINDLASILLKQGKHNEVIELYQKNLPELPDIGVDPLSMVPDTVAPPKPENCRMDLVIRCYTEAHFNLGEALSRQERGDEAVKHYAEAIRIKPDYLIARQALAKALILQGKTDFAIEQLKKCLELAPESIDLRATLVTVLLSKNRTDEAILQAGEIMRSQPDSPLGFYTLARAYQKQGKLSDAAEAFNKAAELAKISGNENLAKQIQQEMRAIEVRR